MSLLGNMGSIASDALTGRESGFHCIFSFCYIINMNQFNTGTWIFAFIDDLKAKARNIHMPCRFFAVLKE